MGDRITRTLSDGTEVWRQYDENFRYEMLSSKGSGVRYLHHFARFLTTAHSSQDFEILKALATLKREGGG